MVEDEQDAVQILEYNLKKAGFQTRSAMDGREALEQAFQEPIPDLVLLDLMLPDISGTEVCRQLRADERTRDTPVIMLTAKGEEIDRVVGFEVGADDYVVKPFFIRELILRINAILRRLNEVRETSGASTFGCLKLDTERYQAWVEGREIRLTSLEFRLLETLLSRKGRVQSRAVLLDDVWDIQSHVQTRTVDAHINRLREKLGKAGTYIETLRGVGYRFYSSPEQVQEQAD
ncbi:MAG: response regulator transcription factor [Sedimenticola sp.]